MGTSQVYDPPMVSIVCVAKGMTGSGIAAAAAIGTAGAIGKMSVNALSSLMKTVPTGCSSICVSVEEDVTSSKTSSVLVGVLPDKAFCAGDAVVAGSHVVIIINAITILSAFFHVVFLIGISLLNTCKNLGKVRLFFISGQVHILAAPDAPS